jgi:hypothetical protein
MRPQKPCHQPHGTATRYVAGCSCLDCCEAWAAYAADAREGRRYVRRNLDPGPVRRHILYLLNQGLMLKDIAHRAAVRRETIRAIRDKRYSSVKRETADAIFGVSRTGAQRPPRP